MSHFATQAGKPMRRSLIERSGSGTSIVRPSDAMTFGPSRPHWWCYFTGSNDKICRHGLLYSMLQNTALHAFLEFKNVFWRTDWTMNTTAVHTVHSPKMHTPGDWSEIPIPILAFAGDDHGGIHLLDLRDGRSVDCYRWEQGWDGIQQFWNQRLAPEIRLKVQLMGKWFQKNKTQLEGLTAWYWDCDHCFCWFWSLHGFSESCEWQDKQKQKWHSIYTTARIAGSSASKLFWHPLSCSTRHHHLVWMMQVSLIV